MDPISLRFVLVEMFTILKGFEMVSSPAIHFQYSLLLGRLTCLGMTESSFVLNSY